MKTPHTHNPCVTCARRCVCVDAQHKHNPRNAGDATTQLDSITHIRFVCDGRYGGHVEIGEKT